jgi:tetratricopeptide (TPR) repeat protein
VLLALIAHEQGRGQGPQASRLAADWLARHPDDTGVRLQLAEGLAAQGDATGAIAAYDSALAALPETAPAAAGAAARLALLVQTQDPRRALALAERAHRLAPTDGDVADTLGRLLLDGGEPARALAPLAAARRQRPDDPGISYRYARALAATGDPGQARRLLLGILDRQFAEHAQAIALLGQLGD